MVYSHLVVDAMGCWPEVSAMTARAAAIVATTAPLWLPIGKRDPVVRVGLIESSTSPKRRAAWRRFVDDLRHSTRMKVQPFFATNEPLLMAAMRADQIHLGCLQDGRVVCRKHLDPSLVQRIRDCHAAHCAPFLPAIAARTAVSAASIEW